MAQLSDHAALPWQGDSSYYQQEDNPQAQNDEQGYHQAPSAAMLANDSLHSDIELAPKKKKKKRKSGRKKAAQATGFEDYYVDAPLTPEEWEEERETYDQRIETAINRFTAKRRLDSVRKNVFDKYLAYGGIKTGQNMFTGMDKMTLSDANAGEIAEMTSTSQVDHEQMDEHGKQFVVDFDGVLKGFISSRLQQIFVLWEEGQISLYIGVILNFLNYLAYHDVCPEYASQILAARRTCREGEWQLESCHLAACRLPGDVNVACSTIFGGYHQERRRQDEAFYGEDAIDLPSFSHAAANRIFTAGFAAHGTPRQHIEYNEQAAANRISIVDSFPTGLEIISTTPATADVRDMYAHPSMAGLKCTGTFVARTWPKPSAFLEDRSPHEEDEARRSAARTSQDTTYELWLEDDLMPHLFPGMKLNVTLKVTSFGLTYLDDTKGVYCSFYRVLPNEAMIGWREHVYLPPRCGRDGDGMSDVEEFVSEDEGSS